ncbi:HK97-gp10 family putative phage morphogenesis protein [Streptomyces pharetrae]|uniref:HK97-gp10 family putative phage morphogenesis protein n=1 Tax=Streptomyces pharetrae TaxID=291370 RepID=UPI003668E9E0
MNRTRVVVNPGWEMEIRRAAERKAEEIAEEVAKDARRLAPVDTGHLRASIRTEGNQVIAEADYAAYVELGTEDQRAQPFLRPALYRKRS